MTPYPRSFTDTLGIWHSQPVYYESQQGLITKEYGQYRVWVKTRHGTYHLGPIAFEDDRAATQALQARKMLNARESDA
jgi:hypothetical protein